MGHLPFAFSVHQFVNSVGSDAGFASIIGLAILVLLYFAHARETAALREQSEEASMRVQALEAQVASLTQAGRPVGAVAPVSAAQAAAPARPVVTPAAARAAGVGSGVVRTPAPASVAGMAAASGAAAGAVAYAGQTAPSAPAGVGAPPLTAATRLIPAGGGGAPLEASAAAPAVTGAPLTSIPPTTTPPSPPSPPPASPVGTNGTGEHPVPRPAQPPVPAPTTPAAQNRRPVQPRPVGGPGAARLDGALPRRPAVRAGGSGGVPRLLVVALLGLGLAAVIAVLLIATSGGGGKTLSSSSTPASNAPVTHHRAAPEPFNNSSVTVAVLNGTPTTGLAGRTSKRLVTAGFQPGNVASASDQTRTATVVAYMPGHKQGALAVAKALGLGSASVQPVDQPTQQVACPGASACTANVVVTLGADLASQ